MNMNKPVKKLSKYVHIHLCRHIYTGVRGELEREREIARERESKREKEMKKRGREVYIYICMYAHTSMFVDIYARACSCSIPLLV